MYMCNYSKITTPSGSGKSDYALLEQDNTNKIVSDILNKVDNTDLHNMQSISSKNSH